MCAELKCAMAAVKTTSREFFNLGALAGVEISIRFASVVFLLTLFRTL